jgi:hypothetical protein
MDGVVSLAVGSAVGLACLAMHQRQPVLKPTVCTNAKLASVQQTLPPSSGGDWWGELFPTPSQTGSGLPSTLSAAQRVERAGIAPQRLDNSAGRQRQLGQTTLALGACPNQPRVPRTRGGSLPMAAVVDVSDDEN